MKYNVGDIIVYRDTVVLTVIAAQEDCCMLHDSEEGDSYTYQISDIESWNVVEYVHYPCVKS